jgi:outer membrane receptor for ferrienterochelin and colicins
LKSLKISYLKGIGLILVLFPFFCYSQLHVSILNEIDNTPVAYAPFKWKNLNTGKTLQSQANEFGKFSIEENQLPVIIFISYLGFEIKQDSFFKPGSFIINLRPDLKYLPEAVVTDQYTATSAEKSINKVIIIDEKKIKSMAAVNLNDILTNQLNVKLGQDNLLGSSMALMGISGQNVKILIDGVPIIGRQNGNIDLSQINLNNVERIEIIEGPLSVAYGTNALAGAINIITKKKSSHKMEVNASAYYETVGRYNSTLNIGLRKTNGIYNFSFGRNYFDGWSEIKQVRYQDWKPKEQYFGRFQYLRKIGLFDLTIKSEALKEKLSNKGLPRMPYQETAFDEYYYTRRFDNSVTATSKLPHNRYLNLIAAFNTYSRTKNRYLFNRVTLDKNLVPEQNEQDTTKFNTLVLRGTFTKSLLNAKLNYQIGYDINSETGRGSKFKNSNTSIHDFATFLSMEISPIDRITIKPGIRLAVNSVYKSIPLPSLNLKFQSKKGYTLRTSYARGFRAPDLKELYLYFVDVNHDVIGNPNLNAEKSNNIQLSLLRKLIFKKSIIQPEVALFYNSINDRIILTNIQKLTYTYRNLSYFKSLNSNVSVSLKLPLISANIGYAMNTISTEKQGFKSAFTNHEVTANLSYIWKKPQVTASIFSKTTSPSSTFILDDIGGTILSKINGYTWIDITICKPFLKSKWLISSGIKNLTGITNVQMTGSSGGVHGGGNNAMLFATGRIFFLKLDYYFVKK